jgi:plasmid stability protein
MGQLIVRNLDDNIIQALRRRAAQHGRSAEAEHREILRESLAREVSRGSFKSFLASMPAVGSDADFAPPRDLPRDIRP